MKYFLNGLAILFLALTTYIIIATVGALTKGNDANIFGYSISVVASDSMEDTIMTGDFIIYKRTNFEKVEVDDISVFVYVGSNSLLQGKKIVHRVVGINPDGSFITKGDKYSSVDEDALTADNYIGKVVHYTSLFGLGSLRLNNLGIFFGIVILGFFILIALEVRNLIRNYRKLLKEEREKSEKSDEE